MNAPCPPVFRPRRAAALAAGALLACLSVVASPALADDADAPAPNLIPNPGFENGTEGKWHKDDFAHLGGEFALDTQNPHSGKSAWRISLNTESGSLGEVHAFCGPLPLAPGMALQLRFWMRGKSNTGFMKVLLRKMGAPYTTYWSAQCAPTDEWTESVLTVIVPPKADPDDTVLMFTVRNGSTIWLDDVQLSEIPKVEGGEPPVGNQVRNGSFETGADGWFATFREYGVSGPAADEINIGSTLESAEAKGAPWGARALHLDLKPGGYAMVTSSYFHLRYGRPATVSFWAKGTAGHKLALSLGSGKFSNLSRQDQSLTLNSEWTFYSFPFTPTPSVSGRYFLEFTSHEPGPLLLDGVAAVEGDQPLRDAPPLQGVAVGTAPAPGGDPANMFSKGDKADFVLRVLSDGSRDLEARVVDPWDQVVGRFDLPVKKAVDVPATVPLSLPTDRFGGFKCVVSEKGGDGRPLAEILYVVVPQLKPLKEAAPDSFFGTNALLTPYNLHIMEKGGFRWLRLYGPIHTLWITVEPRPGEWTFSTEGIRRAHEMGFQILGLLATVPPWHADVDPQHAADYHWWNSSPPNDWDAWADYVHRTQAAFGDIHHWEVWNEPDCGYLQVKPGEKHDDVYLTILEHTAAVSRPGDTVIGDVASHFPNPFIDGVLEKGGAAKMDAFSFHDYDASSGRSPDEMGNVAGIEAIGKRTNRSGQPLPLWVTEEGVYLDDGKEWLELPQIPTTEKMSIGDAASTIVRTVVCLKAIGLQRHFFYAALAQPSGRAVYRDDCSGMIDVNGIPLPSLAAHAAMVSFLEDAPAEGFEELAVDGKKVSVAHFRKDGKKLDVLWAQAQGAVPLGAIPGVTLSGRQAFDLMANPIPVDERTVLTRKPIYLLEGGR